MIRKAKTRDERERIRYGPLGVEQAQTREQMMLVRKLCQDIENAEAQMLEKYYRAEPIDPKTAELFFGGRGFGVCFLFEHFKKHGLI